ncbi:MAG: bacteriophage Gp15 family protein [Ruminococcus sp.]|nr:bacteriophage Gp15 family protein [Ruminococcus sp.]
MINALYEPFPDTISADGEDYPIITDFREWLKFADMAADNELSSREKLLLMTQWLLEPPQVLTAELVRALCDFYKGTALERDLPEAQFEDEKDKTDMPPEPPVLNWKIDAAFIIGDFQRFYGIDLLTAEMHWWRFRLLFHALPEESQMMRRIGYRKIDIGQIKNESERKRVMKLKQLYALPIELDEDDIAAVFGGGM